MINITQGLVSIDGFIKAFLVDDRWKLYLEGLKNTLLLSLGACVFGILIGLVIAIVKYRYQQAKQEESVGILLRVLNALVSFYTTVIRGTPVLLQLLILYTIAFDGGFEAALVGFALNSGAYVSEIIRGGLQSVDVGQTEAGRSLGLSSGQTMRLVVVPQAFKNAIPSLFNEFIALIKETSVAGSLAVRDITKLAEGIKARIFSVEPLVIAAILYLILVVGLTQVQKVLERRMARSDRN